jgi:hypothetical protein
VIAGYDLGMYTLLDEVVDRLLRIGPDLLGQYHQRGGCGLRQRLGYAHGL